MAYIVYIQGSRESGGRHLFHQFIRLVAEVRSGVQVARAARTTTENSEEIAVW